MRSTNTTNPTAYGTTFSQAWEAKGTRRRRKGSDVSNKENRDIDSEYRIHHSIVDFTITSLESSLTSRACCVLSSRAFRSSLVSLRCFPSAFFVVFFDRVIFHYLFLLWTTTDDTITTAATDRDNEMRRTSMGS
jgi:hypothetical protein